MNMYFTVTHSWVKSDGEIINKVRYAGTNCDRALFIFREFADCSDDGDVLSLVTEWKS